MKYYFCNITNSVIMYPIGPMQYVLSLELVLYYTVLSLFHIHPFSNHGMRLYFYLRNYPKQTYNDGQVYVGLLCHCKMSVSYISYFCIPSSLYWLIYNHDGKAILFITLLLT
jgi:hypothetical protein